MRLLLVSNFYPPHVVGGAELVAASIAEALARQGEDVHVLATCSPEAGESETVQAGVRVHRFFPKNLWWNFERFDAADRRSLMARLHWNLRDRWNQDAARRFGMLLDRLQPDIVHTHNVKGFSPALWSVASRRGIATVHTAHDYYLLCNRGTTLGRSGPCNRRCAPCALAGTWNAACARSIDHLCTPSRFMLDRHLAAGIRGRHGRAVVPNGVAAPGAPRAAAPDGGGLRLLFIGQVRREKGAHLLPGLLEALGPEVRLDVAGTGALVPMLQDVASRDRRLHLHGFVEGAAKQALFAAADALIFPSIWTENAPLVIAEALAAGLPVVASDLGAIPEFLQHGENGLLVAPDDAAALAAAAGQLAATSGLLARLVAGAEHRGRQHSVARMVDGYRAVYAAALARPQQVVT